MCIKLSTCDLYLQPCINQQQACYFFNAVHWSFWHTHSLLQYSTQQERRACRPQWATTSPMTDSFTKVWGGEIAERQRPEVAFRASIIRRAKIHLDRWSWPPGYTYTRSSTSAKSICQCRWWKELATHFSQVTRVTFIPQVALKITAKTASWSTLCTAAMFEVSLIWVLFLERELKIQLKQDFSFGFLWWGRKNSP